MFSFSSYAEWIKVNEDTEGDSYYIDFETVKEIDGYVHWWEMRDYLKPYEGNMSSITYYQGDCEATRSKILSRFLYEKPMGTVKSFSLGDIVDLSALMPWTYIPPNTVAKDMLQTSCSLADQSSMNNYQSIVEELKAEMESIEWEARSLTQEIQAEHDQDRILVIEDQFSTLKNNYIGLIAARVKKEWRYMGAEDHWGCDVYIIQDEYGWVEGVNVQGCTIDDSDQAASFKNSIERAVYNSSPLPLAPDRSVFDTEILFYFRVN